MKSRKTIKAVTAPKRNSLVAALKTNDTVTENGAVSNSTTGTSLLDFFSKAGAMRQADEQTIKDAFDMAYMEDKTTALRILFHAADVREGSGERRLFRVCMKHLAQTDTDVARELIQHIPEFTRFDNVLESLSGTPIERDALQFMADQLRKDVDAKSPTLAGKWAPAENATSPVTRSLGNKLRAFMHMTPKAYRKMLTELRSRIHIVETPLTRGDFKVIDYTKVPSNASTRYRNTFLAKDEKRYRAFLGKLVKGEVKINSSVLYPYDIAREVRKSHFGVDVTLDEQWKRLPNLLEDNAHNGIVVADVSGSMDSQGYGSVAPIDVAISLAVYIAERNTGAFHNHIIRFSAKSEFIDISGRTIQDRLRKAMGDREVANTNLQSVFNMILSRATACKVPQKEMPSVIYVISDMQFDSAVDDNELTNLAVIKQKYTAAGYKLPRIVFWNVNARADTPATINDKGVSLISGASPNILKTAIGGKDCSYQLMLETVNAPRYRVIKV